MGLALDTDVYAMIRAAYEEDKECEHSQHNDPKRNYLHHGKAEWYGIWSCDGCGHVNDVIAYCFLWKVFIDSDPVLTCHVCHKHQGPASTFYKGRWVKM